MPRRGTNTFKRNDFRRAVRSAQEAGLTVSRVEIAKDGTISIIVGELQSPADEGDSFTRENRHERQHP